MVRERERDSVCVSAPVDHLHLLSISGFHFSVEKTLNIRTQTLNPKACTSSPEPQIPKSEVQGFGGRVRDLAPPRERRPPGSC